MDAFGQWQGVGGGVSNGQAYDLLWDGSTERLYVFGGMRSVGIPAVEVKGTTYWKDGIWHAMDGGVDHPWAGAVPEVTQGLFYQGDLVVVGAFDSIGDTPHAAGVARWRNEQWEALDTVPAYNVNLYGLSVIGDQLHLHGNFDTIGGLPVNSWAIYENGQWSAADTIVPYPWGTKEAVEYDGRLYIGGNFETPDGRNDLLMKVGDEWQELGPGLQGDCYVADLEVYDGLLWVAGFFFSAAGNAATGIIAWDGTQWLDPFPQMELIDWGRSLHVANDKLYLVGPMAVQGLNGEYRIAEYDGMNLCIRGGNAVWTGMVAVSSDTIYANACEQQDCIPPSGPIVNGLMKLPLDWPADTCFAVEVGMDEPLRAVRNSLTAYPNPATSEVVITGLPETEGVIRVRVTDAIGREVANSAVRITDGRVRLPLPQLQSGVYHARFDAGSPGRALDVTIAVQP